MKIKLQTRLLASLFLLLTFILVLIGTVLLRDADQRLKFFQLTQAKYQAKTLAEGSLDALVTEDYELLERWVASAIPSDQYAYAALVKPNGVVLSHSDLDMIAKNLGTIATLTQYGPVVKQSLHYKNRPIIEVVFPAIVGSNHLANAHIAYFTDTQKMFADTSILWIISTLFIALLALTLGIYLITRLVINPIKYLTEAIGNSPNDEVIQLREDILQREDEVGALANVFLSMSTRLITRLEELKSSQQSLAEEVDVRTCAQKELVFARDEAIAANVAKSRFLANMSHELRTPLNAVIGYSQLLKEIAEEDGLDYIINELTSIHKAGNHLLSVINDILDISVIESNKIKLNLSTFNLDYLLEETSHTIQPMLGKNNNTFHIKVLEPNCEMHSDKVRVQQILLNLLANANKFTKDGSINLTIETQNSKSSEWVVFRVTDTGIGIDPLQLDTVFNSFTQADNSSTRSHDGVGLGLTICKRFCEIMGGSIEVESELDKGSMFTVKLPKYFASETSQPQLKLLSGAGH